ncbi:glycoside hydrolase family 125 protein [Dothidotthia symphoricarpi CBS 119687]|uniref:Glycoside hydrolase family 125 protein n=1 Tax=Dothidotthia symphoricarpi CBS 119687 TaxID=1392245 RepID=A0A6A5ZYM0_9PLEO|nr:glycoside hydrolase family 125 protein [Dothidotthia symphoricarpi CBS 119687]KAF2124115.1 glycoside hydrolase family 125 protein [Dothidotthia symphoricarpi CBS 119687]
MHTFTTTLLTLAALLPPTLSQCPLYTTYASSRHPPYTETRHNLSYARPIPSCRTFPSQDVEATIARLRHVITDPDLFRLFENSWPSTLDTTIAWRGWSNASRGEPEELTFVITGDIEAMWLRDSANQLQAYLSVLKPSGEWDSLASVFRGAVNLQARYVLEAPFCNAFQAPEESGRERRSSMNSDRITPAFDYMSVFSCQWELDSLASFLQLSADYAGATGDWAFFGRGNWTRAVETVLQTAESMMIDSYDEEGNWQHTPYTYCAPYGGTPINDCNGSPHRGNIGLVRSFHRPSDDACLFQYLIPSNMMFSTALNASADIVARLPNQAPLAARMRALSAGIRTGITTHGIVNDPKYGPIFAYEIDGYGSANIMDDPNIPSLLSAPWINYTHVTDPIYAATRRKILSRDNPYYTWGPVLSGVGSMHTLPGRAWPMANVMSVLTSGEDEEVLRELGALVGSTDGFGVLHESVDSHREGVWSRQWFSWANGLFGQAVLELERGRPWVLGGSFQ